MREALAQLRERYFLMAPPLVMLIGLGAARMHWLAIVAGVLLALLTANWLVQWLRRGA